MSILIFTPVCNLISLSIFCGIDTAVCRIDTAVCRIDIAVCRIDTAACRIDTAETNAFIQPLMNMKEIG